SERRAAYSRSARRVFRQDQQHFSNWDSWDAFQYEQLLRRRLVRNRLVCDDAQSLSNLPMVFTTADYGILQRQHSIDRQSISHRLTRSEERRVGKEERAE